MDCIDRLVNQGIKFQDARALRRIAMTLHRWAELECGIDTPSGATYCVERDEVTGKPFATWSGDHRHSVPDREAGALRRLRKIMRDYPCHWAYHQTDPRGAALYIGRAIDLPPAPATLDSCYTRGVAVHK